MGTECSDDVSKGKAKTKLYSIFPVKVITIYRTKAKPPMPGDEGSPAFWTALTYG